MSSKDRDLIDIEVDLKQKATKPFKLSWLFAIGLPAAFVLLIALMASMMTPAPTGDFDIKTFAKLPLAYGGRAKPFDTVARNSLLIISGKSTVKLDENVTGGEAKKLRAAEWLLDVLARPEVAATYPVFRIDNEELKNTLGLDLDEKRFSYQQVIAREETFGEQVNEARKVDEADRDAYQQSILQLAERLNVYHGLLTFDALHLVPPQGQDTEWRTIYASENILAIPPDQPLPPMLDLVRSATPYREVDRDALPIGILAYGRVAMAFQNEDNRAMIELSNQTSRDVLAGYHDVLGAYAQQDATAFNAAVSELANDLDGYIPYETNEASLETFFNRIAPFFQSQIHYVVGMLLIFFSWMFARTTLLRTASVLVGLALIIHTLGLIARILISDYAPVTNLYSSAVFIGWGCVLLGVIVEYLFRNSFGLLVAALIGVLTLQVARGLSGDGDTMAVMQAVLDTNFWLATHVVAITLGYTAMFFAGFLGIVFILMGVFTPFLNKELHKSLGQIIYGVVCFAVLLSFIGTVLGGIWADQSWGRFWGWDPKENGAALIVLWSAIILHARWGGMVKQRGVAVMAVFGNIITSWSWFGVNMLGAGLHAYGFIDQGVLWMLVFVTSQLLVIGIGLVPKSIWWSYNAQANDAKALQQKQRDRTAPPPSRGRSQPAPA